MTHEEAARSIFLGLWNDLEDNKHGAVAQALLRLARGEHLEIPAGSNRAREWEGPLVFLTAMGLRETENEKRRQFGDDLPWDAPDMTPRKVAALFGAGAREKFAERKHEMETNPQAVLDRLSPIVTTFARLSQELAAELLVAMEEFANGSLDEARQRRLRLVARWNESVLAAADAPYQLLCTACGRPIVFGRPRKLPPTHPGQCRDSLKKRTPA